MENHLVAGRGEEQQRSPDEHHTLGALSGASGGSSPAALSFSCGNDIIFTRSCSNSLLVVFLLLTPLAPTGARDDEGWVQCAGWLLSFVPGHYWVPHLICCPLVSHCVPGYSLRRTVPCAFPVTSLVF